MEKSRQGYIVCRDFFKGMMKMKYYDKIDKERLPRHIAIIMDGNGRWAKKRLLPRTLGHKAGVETIREVIKACNHLGIEFLTLYAFSTENWKRPKEEVGALMNLLVEYLRNEVAELHENRVRIKVIGDISALPAVAQKELHAAIEKTEDNTGVTMSLSLNYGSRSDIKQAMIKMIRAYEQGELEVDEIGEETLRKYLSTSFLPDPDLIIRPSGEYRLSNFLMWEAAYSEFWFSDIYWPDFTKEDLHQAIYDFQRRDRRFGKVR